MSIKTRLQDGTGGSGCAEVQDNALVVMAYPHPPLGRSKTYPFRQFLTQDGTAAGVSSMKAAGTLAVPVKYYVGVDADDDRYITTLSFVIAGAAPVLNQFAAIAALTNGCKLYYEQSAGNRIIHDTLKSNFDFVRMCLGNPTIGATTNAFQASNVIGTAEAYIPVLDLARLIPPFGIKLDAGTTQRLVLEVRDNTNVAGVVGFDCIAYGFDRIP